MPAQLVLPVVPDWHCRAAYTKADMRGDDTDIAATVRATDAAGEYPALRGPKKPGITTIQEADNTLMLGVATFGKLTPSMMETAIGELTDKTKSREAAHNRFVSNFQNLSYNTPMYNLIAESVEVHDAEVALHNLGCALVAARVSNQPAQADKLKAIIDRFTFLVNYQLDLVVEHLESGKRSESFEAIGMKKSRQSSDQDYVQKEIARFEAIRNRIGVAPASAQVHFVMEARPIYLLRSTASRTEFWSEPEQLDLIFSFYAWARGPMHIKTTFQRSPNFWAYAVMMFASFCDNAYGLVIGVEKGNERFTTQASNVFLRTAKRSMLQPNRKAQQALHHNFNTHYNEQMRLHGMPERQITDIDEIYVDKYVRGDNVLKRGTKKAVRPAVEVADDVLDDNVPAYAG